MWEECLFEKYTFTDKNIFFQVIARRNKNITRLVSSIYVMSSSKTDISKKPKPSDLLDDDLTVTDASVTSNTTAEKKKKTSNDDLKLVPRMLFSLKSNTFQQAEEIMKMKSKNPSFEEVQEFYHWIVSTKRKMKAWTRDKI